ncbi:MAG: hypothetical protein C0436_01845 [Alphaproteobacteria bacterium]|nr:hypothetical protein [Alphaproteobacteria bacterium]
MTTHHIIVNNDVSLEIAGRTFDCVIGKQGKTPTKQEGDGKTPCGTFPLRQLLYRADRVKKPITGLPVQPIKREDGWCDDPAHPAYNTHIVLPFSARHEVLWREDSAYDYVVVIGYNDNPVKAGAGSAIFMHLMQPDGRGTEGCVALSSKDMQEVLALLGPRSTITIR